MATSSKITPNAFNISGQFDEVTGGVVTNGLVTYLDAGSVTSYPGAGNIIKDLSGNGCDATIMGGVTYVANGAASYFNWSSTENDGNYLVGYMGTTLGATVQDLTIVFYPNSVGQNYNFATLVSNALASTQNDRALRVQPLTAGTWLVANPGNSNDWARTATNYYVNGALAGTAFQSINSSTDIAINTNQWQTLGGARTNSYAGFDYNGYYYIGEGGYPQRGWSGGIAAVLFYNRVLTAQEQLENYNYFAARYGLTPQRTAPVYKTISSGNVVIGGQFDEVTYNTAGVKKNLINSSVFMANAGQDRNYWNTSVNSGLFANPRGALAPDGTNTALSVTMTDIAHNYPIVSTGTSTTLGNTFVLTPGQWYTASIYFSRPGLTASLGTNPSFNAIVFNSTNAFGGADLFRNQVEYPTTNAQGVLQTLTAITNTNTNGGSLKFMGSGNLTSTGTGIMAFGTGNFTIEYYGWTGQSYYGVTVFDSRTNTSSNNGLNDQWYGNQYVLQVGGSTVFNGTSNGLTIYGNWSHIAIVRSGTGANQTAVYINGVLNGTFTCATNFTDPNLVIGNRVDNTLNLNKANITNFRVTKGVALYSGNFAIPTTPPTASANTSLLLNVIQPGAFTVDSSPNNYTLVNNNGVTYSSFNPNYNGWYRLAMPFQATQKYENFQYWCNGFGGPVADGNVTLLWGAQLEAGNVATIYQPTVTSNIAPPVIQRIENTGNVYISGAYDEVSQPLSPVTDSSLIMHLDPALLQSYPGTGNVWYDLSGNKNNANFVSGTNFSGATPITPIYSTNNGGYVSFTGSGNALGNKCWANTSISSKTFSPTSERTMSIWVRFHPTIQSYAYYNPNYNNLTDIPPYVLAAYPNPPVYNGKYYTYNTQGIGTYVNRGSTGVLFGCNNYGDYGMTWYTYYNISSSQFVFGVQADFRELTSDYGPSYQLYNSATSALIGQWLNIVTTYSQATNAAILYINGSAVGSSIVAPLLNSTYPYNLPTLSIGLNSSAGGDAYTATLDADVGQVLLYTRALSSAEVTQNFTTYRGRYGV